MMKRVGTVSTKYSRGRMSQCVETRHNRTVLYKCDWLFIYSDGTSCIINWRRVHTVQYSECISITTVGGSDGWLLWCGLWGA